MPLYHEGPNRTVDVAVCWRDADSLDHVLLVRRRDETWALPGGFVDAGETAMVAAQRELREETGLALTSGFFEIYQGRVYDPRERLDRWVETTLFLVRVHGDAPTPRPGDDARQARWWSTNGLSSLDRSLEGAFYADHRFLLRKVLRRRSGS